MGESNDRWAEYYKEWSNCYEKWYNKYRNEIYNRNKIMKKRPNDIDLHFNDYICGRVANDIYNHVDWRRSMC